MYNFYRFNINPEIILELSKKLNAMLVSSKIEIIQ